MAAYKRQHEVLDLDGTRSKKSKADSSDKALDNFLGWCESEGLSLNEKVTLSRNGSCAQYGMIAVDDIESGTTLFEIPRPMLLSSETSQIAKLLQDESDNIESRSGWIPLLLSLMHEFTSEKSRWQHYFHLVPDFQELDLPMFWSKDHLDSELKGTGVYEAVNRDLESMKQEFEDIVLPFIKRHSELFKPACEQFEFYMKMVAFVMAYSFTEPDNEEDDDSSEDGDVGKMRGKKMPMMVPMADMLNHVAHNNAHLDFGKESLKMVATKSIKKGSEVFNTYGELPNYQLLHMYGFAEAFPNNIYDAVNLPFDKIYAVLSNGMGQSEKELAQRKWKFLQDTGCVTDNGAYVLGVEGVLTEDEMYQMLKVMSMDNKAFGVHQEKEGWSDADDEDNDTSESLSFESIATLPLLWKQMLAKIASSILEEYNFTLDEDDMKVRNEAQLTGRQRFALYVRYGQQTLLNRLITACVGNKV